jgi:hypothetical protein
MKTVPLRYLILVIGAGLSLQGCESSQVRSYMSQLRCGMSLQQVQALSRFKVKPVGQHRLGGYRANIGRGAVWMEFGDGRLTTVTAQTISGLTSARLSPKKDLCTGQLTFFVSLEWPADLQGTDVYLDGQLAAENAKSGLVLEVREGEHVIRLERQGRAPIVKALALDESSRGDQWIDIDPVAR